MKFVRHAARRELLRVVTTPTVLRSDMESLLTTDFRRLDVARRIESRVATIDRMPRHVQDKQGSHGHITRTHPREDR
jgi:hypothetical protein